MRRTSTTRWLLPLGVAIALVASACGGGGDAEPSSTEAPAAPESSATEDSPAAGGTLRVRIGGDVGGFDPASIFQIENQSVAGHVFNGLLRYNEATNEIVPDLATEMPTVSGDGLTYTFTLRQGVQFHAGYGELKASDVVFHYERIKNPDTGSRYAAQVAIIDSVSAVDDYTVVFNLASPNANFLHTVAAFNQGWIVSEAAVQDRGDDFNLNPVGTGPFEIGEYIPGESMSLTAFEDYFGGRASLDEVVFVVIPDESTAEVALVNGEIDAIFALSSPDVVDRLRGNGDVTVHQRTASFVNNLVLNISKPPLDDVRVRQAIAHGINRQAIQDDYFRGLRGSADSWLTEAFQEYTDDLRTYPYDPERARALLEEAGAVGFTFEITGPALVPYSEQVVFVKNDLDAIGINTVLNIVERADYGALRASGNIMASVTSVTGPPNPENPLVTLFASASAPPGMNHGSYSAVDDLLAEARAISDPAARAAAYGEIQRVVAEDIPAIPMYSYQLATATRAGVEGYVQNSYYTFYAYPITLR